MADVTEQELLEKSRAPRITDESLEANIQSEHYFTAADGLIGEANQREQLVGEYPESLGLLTLCVLVLKNGFTVVGQSACASPLNFDKEIGQRVARADAKRQVWAFMGYELRTQLLGGTDNG